MSFKLNAKFLGSSLLGIGVTKNEQTINNIFFLIQVQGSGGGRHEGVVPLQARAIHAERSNEAHLDDKAPVIFWFNLSIG